MYKTAHPTFFIFLCLFVTGCSTFAPSVYRIDIPQGNLISQENIDKIAVGMSRQQVKHILGSPLLMDTFNPNRWDYFYSINTSSKTAVKSHFTIIFANGQVVELIDHQAEPQKKGS